MIEVYFAIVGIVFFGLILYKVFAELLGII